MKTLKQVLQENKGYSTLIKAVIKEIGMNSVNDVIEHGANCGFSGFIYYSDTHAFAIKYRKQIVSMLEEQAESFGMEIPEMVAGFGAFRRAKMDRDDRRDLYSYLDGGKCEQGAITNVMAWYALEEVCRLFED